MSKLRELVNRADTLWMPQERPFTSSTPLLGPAIVLARRAWNWMSAKWYVRPILEQQIAFNSTVVQTINEMAALLEALEDRGQRLEEGLTQLRGQVEESIQQTRAYSEHMEQAHSRRLSEMESSLANQIREAEELTITNDRANVALARDLARLSHRLNEMGSKLPGELSALRQVVQALEQALGARAEAGGKDADSLL